MSTPHHIQTRKNIYICSISFSYIMKMCNPHFFFRAVLVQQLPVCKINTVLQHLKRSPLVSVQSADIGFIDRCFPWDLVLSLKSTFAFDVHHHYSFFSSHLFLTLSLSASVRFVCGRLLSSCCVPLGSLLHKVRVCVIDQIMTNCSRCKATAVIVDGLMSMCFNDWMISG